MDNGDELCEIKKEGEQPQEYNFIRNEIMCINAAGDKFDLMNHDIRPRLYHESKPCFFNGITTFCNIKGDTSKYSVVENTNI